MDWKKNIMNLLYRNDYFTRASSPGEGGAGPEAGPPHGEARSREEN